MSTSCTFLLRGAWSVFLIGVVLIIVDLCYEQAFVPTTRREDKGLTAIENNNAIYHEFEVEATTRAVSPQSVAVSPQQPVAVDGHSGPEYSYVMALHYSDQMTGSACNVVVMQCWASSLGPNARVVEPFVRRSMLGLDDQHRINLNGTATSHGGLKSVKLTDVYDKVEWDKATSGEFTPIVTWDYFIRNSKRKMIIVERECTSGGKCMECGDNRSKDLLRAIQVFIERYGFEIVRRVCYPMKLMMNNKFMELVYDSYSRHEVVVVFNYWGGISQGDFVWRVGISDIKNNRCNRGRYMRNFDLSTQLKHDALRYTENYMSNFKAGYISVMIRLEHYYLGHNRFQGKSNKQILVILETFYQAIAKKVNALKTEHKISSVFLTMDCRQQGSEAFASASGVKKLMSDSIKSLYSMLFGNSSTLEEWDESFYSVSSFRNEGYIAMLQKHLAASGTCLITAGGGIFQDTARGLYSQYHQTKQCVFKL